MAGEQTPAVLVNGGFTLVPVCSCKVEDGIVRYGIVRAEFRRLKENFITNMDIMLHAVHDNCMYLNRSETRNGTHWKKHLGRGHDVRYELVDYGNRNTTSSMMCSCGSTIKGALESFAVYFPALKPQREPVGRHALSMRGDALRSDGRCEDIRSFDNSREVAGGTVNRTLPQLFVFFTEIVVHPILDAFFVSGFVKNAWMTASHQCVHALSFLIYHPRLHKNR